MPKVSIFNTSKEEVGKIDLPESIFAVEVREHLFYEAVRYQLAKRRAGTHSTKGRAEVNGGGKKPFRQKGTGRARAGTTRAPQWRGGGVVHGPHPRSHALKMNKKAKKAALIAALSRRCEEKSITIFDSFDLPEIKTKSFKSVMDSFEFKDLLLVTEGQNTNASLSSRNLQKVKVLPVDGLNVYDILNHSNLALTADAVQAVINRLGGSNE